MPASVTPEYLLKGAAYALEQCGLLLRDANLLYRNGSYASAVAVALFAREELGRYRILLDLRKQVLRGERFTIKEIQDRCWDHVRKQEAGMMSFVLRLVTDPALAKLLDTYLACTRFRGHRVRCFDGAGGVSWRDGSLPASSSLRLCA